MAVEFQIVSEISVKDKSKVYLITLGDKPPFFVLKKYNSEVIEMEFEHLLDFESAFFPQIIDIWREGSDIYIVEEYVAGKTLREIIDSGEVTVDKVTRYMIMLCEAMELLHNHEPKLVHRDIKPENIMIDKVGNLKLIDFDSMRIYKTEACGDTVLLGTKEYASPEQFGFRQTDERSDIYSAGILFKELIADISMDRREKFRISRIIDKATMFDPEKRYQSAEQMLNDIRKLCKKKNNSWKWMVAVSISVLTIGGMVLYLNTRRMEATNGEKNTMESINEADNEYSFETKIDEEMLALGAELSNAGWVWHLNGEIYHWEEEHWAFWGFEDGYDYPDVFYFKDEVGEKPVTEIGYSALAGKERIKEMHVPESVTSIGEDAFQSTDIIFYGKKGSFIEEYCNKNGYQFIEEQVDRKAGK